VQFVQIEAPDEAYFPAEQVWQESALLSPLAGEYVPPLQLLQTEAFVAWATEEYFPATQGLHGKEFESPNSLANLPAPQGMHGADEPRADENEPGLHIMQTPDPMALTVVE